MATPKAGGSKEDPVEKIGKMIEEKIAAALEGRDRTERESKDPWARIEGMIDRTIAKHFEAFAQGLEEGTDAGGAGAGKGKQREDEGEDNPIRALFG